MVNFYQYVIYRLYAWRINNNDNTPAATVILLLVSSHFSQLFLLFAIISKIFPVFSEVFKQHKIAIAVAYITTVFAYSTLVYNKDRWQQYAELFKGEMPSQKRKRGVLVWLFTAGSVILLFILVPLLFWNYKL